MKTKIGMVAVIVMLAAGAACASSSERVARERFPECFADPPIGASSGAKCVHEGGEWKITFWHGWGDCPAGCINTEETGWYKVDARGRVFSCDASFNKCVEAGSGEINRNPAPPSTAAVPAPDTQPAPAKPDPAGKTYCDAHDECFWYSCCQTSPMSKRYRDAHAADLFLQPDRESCDLKCMHELPPRDRRLACVYHTCTPVGKDAPDIDPARPTVWVGRSMVIGQCQDPAIFASGPVIHGSPPTLITAFSAPIPAGPKFTAWIDAWEKERYEGNQERFMCEACDICKTFAREYRLIYLDDLPKYTSGPDSWRRLDR